MGERIVSGCRDIEWVRGLWVGEFVLEIAGC